MLRIVVGLLIWEIGVSCGYGQQILSTFGGGLPKSAVPVTIQSQKGNSWNGTGFLVRISSGDSIFEFLVTARHTIEGGDPRNDYGRILTTYFNRDMSKRDILRGEKTVYEYNIPLATSPVFGNVGFPSEGSVDIAAVLWGAKSKKLVSETKKKAENYLSGKSTEPIICIKNVFILLPDLLYKQIDAQEEIREIFFAGYPFGTDTRSWMHPIVRSGVIASPSTKGYGRHNYGPHAFLIDCGPIPGDSGAPIFTRYFSYSKNTGQLQQISVRLIGVVSKEITVDEISITKHRYHESTEIGRIKLNLGVAYPAKFILDAIYKVLDHADIPE